MAGCGPEPENHVASTNDDTFSKYKLYSGVAIGSVLLAAMLDSCSGGPDSELVAEAAKQALPTAAVIQTAAQNLAPVENLVVVDKDAPAAPARSGEAVYQSACLACHAAGVLGAPKLEAGAWDARIEKGLAGLTTSAINGINAMPARGGNPAITDEEMHNAVSYMLVASGYAVADEAKAPVQQAAATETVAAPASTESAQVAQIAAPAAPEAPKAPQPPVAPVAPQAPVQTATISDGGHTVSSEKYITDGSLGKQVYHNTCFACHDVGIAGSPVIGDTAEWQKRAAAGVDALYSSALNGKGLKPPKGGHPSLTVEQINAAVDYMLASSGVGMAVAATQAAAEPVQQAAPAPATEAQETPAAKPEQEVAPAVPAEAVVEPVEAAALAAAVQAAAPAADAIQSGIDGEKIYRGLCFSCHDAGIAGAPKLGDKTAWAPRIAAGSESMYNNSIKGQGIMPAKGGNPTLTDDEIKAAVDWMVQQSQ